jgi:ubiquinol-cytochrome c reductase cytochrome b subunit
MGVIAMGAAIAVLFVLPWLDRSPVVHALQGLAEQDLAAGVLHGLRDPRRSGRTGADPERTLLSQVCTFLYFAYFILMPFYTRLEKTKPVPERVTG